MAEAPQTLPKAEFIEDVAKYLENKNIDTTIQGMRDKLQSYQLQEVQLMQKRARLLSKLPDLQRGVDVIVELLDKRGKGEELTMDYELSTGALARAKVTEIKTVNIWLGAGVMVQYELEEAKELLSRNLAVCKANINTNEEDVACLKDNITTTQVSIARLYNYDVERRRKLKEEGASA